MYICIHIYILTLISTPVNSSNHYTHVNTIWCVRACTICPYTIPSTFVRARALSHSLSTHARTNAMTRVYLHVRILRRNSSVWRIKSDLPGVTF